VTETVTLRHNKIDLALHILRAEPLDAATPSRPLLLLHGLGDRSPGSVPHWVAAWPGPVAALDFTGHGDSTVPAGGGYSPETLMADVDHALAHLTDDDPDRSITVLGRGLGAYVALQIAGARSGQIHGAILTDGPGLAGGPTGPSSQSFFALDSDGTAPDPYGLVELGRDLRPADYAMSFVALATAGSPLATPITVASSFRPKWLEAVADAPGVAEISIADALAAYA
jgi:pimeloyl-ACP methyl ester carboxylesterase